MTILLAWRNEWSLGIDALDDDHRALVESLTDICLRYCPQASVLAPLGGALRGAPARLSLVDALSDFGDKVRMHCRREEAFLRAIGYHESAEHEAQHAALMVQFDAMLSDYRARGVQVFDSPTREWVRDWLLVHIVDGDREFVRSYFALCGLEGVGAAPRADATRDARGRCTGARCSPWNASRDSAIAIGIAVPKP
ncbi:hemerythrin domain-containing protein [uncultured Thiodictyon sp.]|uniref:bacteriohemerythrin n=1 Tax=uncultured Thiodictyon sp. TaxID=1846217 RepID=UPI0025D430DB|nr:hemerythrin domain-containing protein [uncultured Thiodictyon sp.]